MMLGQDHVLGVSAVHHPQLEYVALGHIHKHQTIREDPPRVEYSGSLQRVDFSEEDDIKGFCVIDLDPALPQGDRMVDFQFKGVAAREFVTIDVRLSSGEPDPTQTVIRAIARKKIADAVVRVRITLPAEVDVQLRESEIRKALEPAHFIAAISRDVEGTRRTRLGLESAEELQPQDALRMYLESREMDPDRRQKVQEFAAELLEQENAGLDSVP